MQAEVDNGCAFGYLVPKLLDKFPHGHYNGAAMTVYSTFCYWHKHKYSDYERMLESAFQSCLDYGDITYAYYAALIRVLTYIMSTTPLDVMPDKLSRWEDFGAKYNIKMLLGACAVVRQYVACLKGRTESLHSFTDETLNESDFEQEYGHIPLVS
jgi:hypothetical protein